MMNMGEKLTEEEMAELCKAADPRAEGHFNYEEFVHLMNGT